MILNQGIGQKSQIKSLRRLNEIKTSLQDGFKIKVTIERLTVSRDVTDELDKNKVQTYKRNTRLVIIEILSQFNADSEKEDVEKDFKNIGSIGSSMQTSKSSRKRGANLLRGM